VQQKHEANRTPFGTTDFNGSALGLQAKTRKQIGMWKLVEKLGSGANANVWKAVKGDGQSGAIKP
jgi:hypothetical protein